MLRSRQRIFLFLITCFASQAFCIGYFSQANAIASLYHSDNITTDPSSNHTNPNQTTMPLHQYHLKGITGGGDLAAGIIFKPKPNIHFTASTELTYTPIHQLLSNMIDYPAGYSPQPSSSLNLEVDVVNIFITNDLYYRIHHKWWGFISVAIGIAALNNSGTFDVASQGNSQASTTQINFSWQVALGVQYHINRYYALNAQVFHVDDGKLPLGEYYKTTYHPGLPLKSNKLNGNGLMLGLTLYA